MRIRKCNGCGLILTKEDDYYTLDEISFNRGKGAKNAGVRVYFNSDLMEKSYDCNESWCNYTDFDFCPECFKKEGLDRFLLKEEK